jgi:hypothetical protein
MAKKLGHRIPEFLQAWLPILAGALGAIVGAIGFYYKDVVLPGVAPINLTTHLTVRKVGGDENKKFAAIELFVTATNPSTRNVYILSNYWEAYGDTVDTPLKETEESKKCVECANLDIASKELVKECHDWGAHYIVGKSTLVGAGRMLGDYVLAPNESVSRSVIFFVPQGAYDLLDVSLSLDTAAKENVAEIVRTVHPDGATDVKIYVTRQGVLGEIAQRLGTIPPTGLVVALMPFMPATRTEVSNSDEANRLDSALQMQSSQSKRQLSLWQSEPGKPPMATTSDTSSPEYENGGKTMPSSATAPN